MDQQNPLLKPFDTPYETVPFDKIKPGHFKPAIENAIRDTKNKIQQIIEHSGEPDFHNTIEALEFSDLKLKRLQQILNNLNSAETNPELQKAAEEIMPEISDFYSELLQNEKLFERVQKVYDNREKYDLNDEQKMLLRQTYLAFVRSGVALSPSEKEEFKKINRRLTELSLQFTKNLLHDTNEYILHVKHEKDLEGLPEREKQAAAEEAKKRNLKGWVFTLHYPSYGPFMKYVKNRSLRKKMYRLFGSRAFHGDAYDNRNVVLEEVEKRKLKAELLGYPSYASFVLEERMAETPVEVIRFLDELYDYAMPHARKEFEKLSELARQDGVDQIQAWDVAYYSEKWKRQTLDWDEEKLKAYFPLPGVLEGMFEVAHKLYGIRFEKADDIPVYHPDVEVYRVMDNDGSFLAVLYLDFYPRSGKRQGAWMTSYRKQYRLNGQDYRPHISIVTNFSKPVGNTPSLLTFNEVNTLFHEFGHALHGMLSDVTYPSLSGTSVYWDFVELPSQIMENWIYQPEALQLFAKHYETGEILPADYIEKLKKEKQFLEGMATVRQLGFGYLDMAWHHTYPDGFENIVQYENEALEKIRLYPYVEGTLISTSFGHLFAGGYAAGYYSYKWAELLDADAFSIFQKNGIFDQEIAQKFRNLLKQGGTKHPKVLYEEFAGRPPQIQALLKRAGFIKSE